MTEGIVFKTTTKLYLFIISMQYIYQVTPYLKYQQQQVHIYRPQRSCSKVIFSQACVKNSVHGGGGLPQCMLGYTPLDRPPMGRHTPPQQTATAADGTHPTGMHSCTLCNKWPTCRYETFILNNDIECKSDKTHNSWFRRESTSIISCFKIQCSHLQYYKYICKNRIS